MRPLAGHPVRYQTCFISYSSKDEVFAQKLHDDLQNLGVQCWLDREDLEIGEDFTDRIDETIRKRDKLLVIFSEHSIHSSWVEREVEMASRREKQDEQAVIFPIRIDNAVQATNLDWVRNIRSTRHIGDFTGWQESDAYQLVLAHLLRDLKADS